MNKTLSHLSLQQSCATLKGVGERTLILLEKLNIHTLQDLLFHLPLRYQDRTRITPIRNLRVGDYAVIEGTIELADLSKGKRRSLLCIVSDGIGKITLRFFYFQSFQQKQLSQRGARIRCFGEVRWGTAGFEIVHPEYRLLTANEPLPVAEYLTPIYPTTEGLHQTVLRKLSEQALMLLKKHPDLLQDYLPPIILEQFHLPKLLEALCYVHRPPPDANQNLLEIGMHPAQQRLAFEELLAQQLSLLELRQHFKQETAPILKSTDKYMQAFMQGLKFQLTGAQQRVIQEIAVDVAQSKPMLRLVQGDVGSGKTVVAAISALYALESNYQVAVMAPTELLAEQHYKNFERWLQPLNLKVSWLAGKLKNKVRQQTLEDIVNGKTNLVIGTHALFQEQVKFSKLALIIIDEQHRFGVHQRLALREKGVLSTQCPHQLIMTATPIPRTLAMVAYADLDISVIDELPPGRTPITTIAISNQRRHEVMLRVRENCQQKKQAYWVCTLIEESEILECEAAEKTAMQLAQALPELKIGLVHGRLKPHEKEQIMQQFKNHELDLLVATTVIEVGVDVPNASLMIIENPERLGLAQLHQLRGRVGRGSIQSHCVLLYQSPLSLQAQQRLNIMRDTQDGFVIAQKDLDLRGPGEVLGTKQTGMLQFKIANLNRDKNLLPLVQESAQTIINSYPQIIPPLIMRWLGSKSRYGNV